MKAAVLAHVLRVNLWIKKRHTCDGSPGFSGCHAGFDLGIGLDAKWDWMHELR